MIGNLIKSERASHGIKQKNLAKGICSTSYLSKIENNQVEPSPEILRLLYNRLNLNLELIYTDEMKLHFYRDELFSIYEEVIQKRTASFTEEKLTYLRDHQSNYLSKELFFNFKLLQLYLLLILNKEPKEIELQIATLSNDKQRFDRTQSYLYEKCIGIYYYNKNQLSAAEAAFDRAGQKLPIEHFGDYEKADLAYMNALAKLANNQFIQCITLLEYPLTYFLNHVSFSRLIECFIIEGIAHQKLGNLERAHQIYIKALKMAENSMQNTSIAMIYQNLGSVNSSIGNLEESLEYFFKSYKLKLTTEKRCISIFSIIQIYSKLDDYAEMEKWIKKGLVLVESLESYKSYYYHFKMYHHLFIQFGDLKFINEALNYFEQVNDLRHVYKYGIKIAELLKKQRKYKQATYYYERATFSNNQNVRYWEDL